MPWLLILEGFRFFPLRHNRAYRVAPDTPLCPPRRILNELDDARAGNVLILALPRRCCSCHRVLRSHGSFSLTQRFTRQLPPCSPGRDGSPYGRQLGG